MSTIASQKTLHRFLALVVTLIGLCGCFDNESKSEPMIFERTELSYHGTTPRNLGLQFKMSGNEERTVIAVVKLPEYLDFKNQKIQYRWQIDEGVEVIDGERTGEVTVVTSGKTLEILLRVNNFSSENKKFLRLEVFSGIGRNRFYIDGLVSSQSESSFENFVQDIENYKKKVHWNDEK